MHPKIRVTRRTPFCRLLWSMIFTFDNTINMTLDCDHYVCDIDDDDLEAVMTKIDEWDVSLSHLSLSQSNSGVDVVDHYGEFVSFWLEIGNSRYVTNELFRIYLAQAAKLIVNSNFGEYRNAHIRLNYAILVKTIYEEKIYEGNDNATINYILSHFESDTSMVHFTRSHLMCNCLDEYNGGSCEDYYPPFLDYLYNPW